MSAPNLPTKMWAAQVVEFNSPYNVHQVPLPLDLAPQDLLFKVAVASLCHTDSMVSSGKMGTPLPCTASHEGAGTVVAKGSSVTDFAIGDRVIAGLLYHAYGTCAECRGPSACPQYCQKTGGFLGVTNHGYRYEHGITVQTNAFQGLGEIEKLVELAHGGRMKGKGIVIMDQEQIEREKKLGAGLRWKCITTK